MQRGGRQDSMYNIEVGCAQDFWLVCVRFVDEIWMINACRIYGRICKIDALLWTAYARLVGDERFYAGIMMEHPELLPCVPSGKLT